MTATLVPQTPAARQPPGSAADAPAAERLRAEMAAVRLSFTWWGVRKTLSPEQKSAAAESFGAAGEFLSAGKKLVDTRHPRVKAVAAVRRRAVAYVDGVSLPFPEPAVRLVRRGDLDGLNARLGEFSQELAEEVAALADVYDELRAAARRQLGDLYAASDYPPALEGLFAMSWEFPSVEPPEYLRRLAPRLYEEESRRVAARFDQAVELAEQMFVGELSALVEHLAERLRGDADGRPKVFRDSAVENLREFFARFGRLNVRSAPELDELVARAQSVLAGVAPQALRDRATLRGRVAGQLAEIETGLAALLVDRPRRNILRRGAGS